MMESNIWHIYVMAGMYIFTGIMHFIYPKAYVKIMPYAFKDPVFWVYLSGVVEIVLGLMLCFPFTKDLAIYGLVLMLLAFLWVHVHMIIHKEASVGLHQWVLWLRIPLQFGLIYWAIWYL